MTMSQPDARLIEILACPQDKGPLYYFEDDQVLYNPRLKFRYEIKDGIPVMLAEEATKLNTKDHDALIAKAEKAGLSLNFEAN